ncbi:Vitamin B12-binding protein precursor [Limihaloglobus sulfuriphilus]|uniref:Vitamin B12-binding protein n=1 Tax=Limihaloglobus sulfuriphilus TaxID=1851148 RepID=A0A1Q2MF72_9BACT|nr:helical backbone metal receptor [Limihaloglobus sulfuriphilus]AQQ70892.1 Vitamin B12-binding protein precursor [Limihaloglobus sulfuriphilus]
MKGLVCLSLAAALLCLFSGCDKGESDIQGQIQTPEKGSLRIVSLAPSITEILFQLDLGGSIVGVTTNCDYPEQARLITKIGSLHPDIETLVRLKPTHIFAIESMLNESLKQRLEALELKCTVVKINTIEQITDSMVTIAAACGIAEKGVKLAAELESEIDRYKSASKSLMPKKTLVIVQPRPIVAVGENTFISELVRYAGGSITGVGGLGKYPQLNSESLLAIEPEVIIITDNPYTTEQKEEILEVITRWESIPAVKSGDIYFLNSDIISRPGPRSAKAVALLARAIHPEFNWDNLE